MSLHRVLRFGACAGLFAVQALADNYAATKALIAHEFQTAFKECEADAIAGDFQCQFLVGMLYREGWGVPQNANTAFIWYHRAAEQGGISAQSAIAGMYATGEGVAQNYVLAHMWANLAGLVEGELSPMIRLQRDAIATKMTPEQIAQAQEMARVWMPVREIPAQSTPPAKKSSAIKARAAQKKP